MTAFFVLWLYGGIVGGGIAACNSLPVNKCLAWSLLWPFMLLIKSARGLREEFFK